MASALPEVRLDPGFGTHARRAHDVPGADGLLAETYPGIQLDLTGSVARLDMRLEEIRLGDLTARRLAFGRQVRLQGSGMQEFHVDLVLEGRASLSDGRGGAVTVEVGQGAIFSPGARGDTLWSQDCTMMCLTISRERLEAELETLLGRRPPEPLRFDFALRLDDEAGRRWQRILSVALDELQAPVLRRLPAAERHLESLVIQGLLIAQPHNHRAALLRQTPSSGSAVQRAAELLRADPGAAWTSVGLAAAVHLSVRALQEGFQRELGIPPMPYLREVRLQRVHELLTHPTASTSVGSAAGRLGFLHLGRFAGHYLRRYGELPSVTLARSRSES